MIRLVKMWSASASPHPFPPKSTQKSIQIPPNSSSKQPPPPPPPLAIRNQTRRSAALILIISGALTLAPPVQPPPASAFGISGPKEWLKDQKKKSIKYLLAPIEASREILRYASEQFTTLSRDEIREVLRSAARDCVPQERNSLVAFQAKTGVEVCTFKLIVKNASSLLDDDDPMKVEAESMLDDLVKSFGVLISGVEFDSDKVGDALRDTLSSLDDFERSIKGCIGVV